MSLPPKRFFAEKEFDNLSVSAAWQILANTNRLNRTIGLPVMNPGQIQVSEQEFYREVSGKTAGMPTMRWREYPFDWIRDRHYAVLRIFENGPFERFYGGVELAPGKIGCVVKVFADFTPRHRIGALISSIVGSKGVQDTLKYCEACLKQNHATQSNRVQQSHEKIAVSRETLDRLINSLKEMPIQPEVISRLRQHLCVGTDQEVLRMRPFALSSHWNLAPYEVLRAFLYATKIGILNLAWELMCPNCRVPKAEYETLADLSNAFHCDVCGINYDANLDRYVELRFSVHPRIRKATDHVYCIGGPYHAPHIIAQQNLAPGMECTCCVTLSGDAIRCRTSRYNDVAMLSGTPERNGENALNPAKIQLTYRDNGWQQREVSYTPGLVSMTLKNESQRTIVSVLEKVEWDTDAVSAARVTSLQEFRDLFGAEVLAPGQQVGVESLSILFSDLKGSTPLYELVGDAPAYGMVRKHFDFLIEVIAEHSGAIVKTIGDAVMAVFNAPENAVSAAMKIQQRIAVFNRENEIQPPIVIKIGVHHGPAIAVNSNDRLDYFGRTVNIAARIQPQSIGGDVVLTTDLFTDADVQRSLKQFQFEATPFRATLKGIEGEFALCRLTVKCESGW